MKDDILSVKTQLMKSLDGILEKKGLSLMQRVILVTDVSEAIQTRIKVFQNHNSNNGHQNSEVKTESEPMYLRRYE